MPRSSGRRWEIVSDGVHWQVYLDGRGQEARLAEQVDAEAYVKRHLVKGDRVFLREVDGYLDDVTRSIGRARSRHWRAAER